MALITCPDCGRSISDAAPTCPGCGRPNHQAVATAAPPPRVVHGAPTAATLAPAPTKPMAGIVVACVLCGAGLLMNVSALSHVEDWSRNVIVRQVPEAAALQLLGVALGMLGNAAVLIGALLALAAHPAGPRTVRISSWAMLVLSLLFSLLRLGVVTGAAAWPGFDPALRAGFVGAMLGGMVGTVVQWGLVLYLFRRSRFP